MAPKKIPPWVAAFLGFCTEVEEYRETAQRAAKLFEEAFPAYVEATAKKAGEEEERPRNTCDPVVRAVCARAKKLRGLEDAAAVTECMREVHAAANGDEHIRDVVEALRSGLSAR